ncbi:MAG: YihY/virulence factor BrkB family protein [Firmicutes bacterium]|nr:YihY/virulence factor BrkB family protein [Bacillota bacterium]
MKEFPKGGLIGKIMDAAKTVKQMHIPLHAAYAAYFIVLAVFPALVLILSVLRYTGMEVRGLVELLDDILPSTMAEGAEELIYSTYRNSSGAMVGVSAVTALWSASRGIYGLLTGLNAVYGVSENRGYIYTRSISVVYTFVFILILLLTLVLHVFGNSIINLMRQVNNPVVIFFTDLIDLRFFLLLFLQSLVFTLMFMVLPNKRRSRFMESLPGGVLSSLGWLVFSDIYSIYVENFSKYSTIYGSVYGIAITMLWLYCCMSILFYGGALNRYLMDK